jgi:hypothetical protein
VAEILVCRTGAISTRTARALGKAGIVVVETDHPEDVKFVRAGEVVTGSAMLAAALLAITGDDTYSKKVHVIFVRELWKAARAAQEVSIDEAVQRG